MSENATTNVVDSSQVDSATKTIAENQTVATDTTVTIPAATTETVEFNPAQYESDYGLPAGHLRDCKDEAAVIKAVQKFADDALKAGLDFDMEETESAALPAVESTAEKLAKAKSATPPSEIEELKKEIAELKSAFKQQTEISETQLWKQVDARLEATVNTWQSPKYGVANQRTYQQKKAVRALQTLARDYIKGRASAGDTLPSVETIAAQLRVHDDFENYEVSRRQKAVPFQPPLGTPGQVHIDGRVNEPRNIHEAYLSGGKFVKIGK